MRVGWQAASVWIHPNRWTEQFRAQPASHPVMRSFTLSARSHDRLENSNCSPSPGRLHLTDIILSDLRSELASSSSSAAGRHSVPQPEWRTFLWHQIDPLSHNPPPVSMSAAWKKISLQLGLNVKFKVELAETSLVEVMDWLPVAGRSFIKPAKCTQYVKHFPAKIDGHQHYNNLSSSDGSG